MSISSQTFYYRPYQPHRAFAVVFVLMFIYFCITSFISLLPPLVAVFLALFAIAELLFVIVMCTCLAFLDPAMTFTTTRRICDDAEDTAADNSGGRSVKVRRPLIGFKNQKHRMENPDGSGV